MNHFSAPTQSLGQLDSETAANLIAAAADIALVLDAEGIIRDMALNSEDLSSGLSGHGSWIGRSWAETVTVESRSKIAALLKDALSAGASRSRQVNHPADQQPDVPVLYSAMQAGQTGQIIAFGRNLQPYSALQRRLVEAQQSMERDYSQLQHVETRYRLLFRISSEPVLIVDGATLKIVEANPAAAEMLGEDAKAAIDRPLAALFEEQSAPLLQGLLAVVRAAGRADDVRARVKGSSEELLVSAFIFRQEGTSLFLVRLSRLKSDAPVGVIPKMTWKLLKLIENAPDGFVVTDFEGRIVSVNAAFLDMAQVANDRQVLGERLDRWIGRPGIDLDVLIAGLRERGTVRLFASTLEGDLGTAIDVEISGAAVMNSEQRCFGFAIRNVARRLKSGPRVGPELPRSVAQLTELVGRVSLKDLVREATDVIEKLSIDAALHMTGGNRASAADMLGLSRQSLYVKLRRYGLADPSTSENGGDGDQG